MSIEEIKNQMAVAGDTPAAISNAIQQLTALIDADPDGVGDVAYIERGKLYWRMGDRAKCITDYNRAAEINPEGDAANLLKMTYDILDFYNKDLFNP